MQWLQLPMRQVWRRNSEMPEALYLGTHCRNLKGNARLGNEPPESQVTMKKRPKWSAKQRAEIKRDNGGKCYLCGLEITGDDFEIEHPLARGLGGSDKQEDMRPAHVDCHKPKTKADTGRMRKADRQMKKHYGTKPKTKHPIPHRPKAAPVISMGSKIMQDHSAKMAALNKRIPPRRFK